MIRGYDSLGPIFSILVLMKFIVRVNYRFQKLTKAYDQGQKMFFALNQYPNDHGSINLS